MKVEIPQDGNQVVEKLFEIMNNKPNGIHQTYEKQLAIKMCYKDILDTGMEPIPLYEEFKHSMDLYIKMHIEEWGFFSYESDYFLSMIEYRQ